MSDSDLQYGGKRADANLVALVLKYPRLFHGKVPECYSYLRPGWLSLVDKLCADIDQLLPDADAVVFVVDQVKEKYGALRFYWTFEGQSTISIDIKIVGNDPGIEMLKMPPKKPGDLFKRVSSLVAAAELSSKNICDVCSAPAEMRVLYEDEEVCAKGYITLGKEPPIKDAFAFGWIACRCDVHANRQGWPQ